jgi:hypothetical protein
VVVDSAMVSNVTVVEEATAGGVVVGATVSFTQAQAQAGVGGPWEWTVHVRTLTCSVGSS